MEGAGTEGQGKNATFAVDILMYFLHTRAGFFTDAAAYFLSFIE